MLYYVKHRNVLERGNGMLMTQDKEELLTPREIAERYRVSEDTIRWHIRKGHLEAIKFGKQYRVSKQALEKFLEEQNRK